MTGTFCACRHPRNLRKFAAFFQAPMASGKFIKDESGGIKEYGSAADAEIAAGRAFKYALEKAQTQPKLGRIERRPRRVFVVERV